MGYDSTHVGVYGPEDGYNLVADQYHKYHAHLDSFDKGAFLKFIPKTSGLRIIDLGAGDGRLFRFFKPDQYSRYVACDIARHLLKRHPGITKVEKIICDLEQPLPFEDETFDLAMSFFVIEHLEDLSTLFDELQRILVPGARWIISHFHQRREFQRKTGKEYLKIKLYNHPLDTIIKLTQEYGFDSDIFPIYEKKEALGELLILHKK